MTAETFQRGRRPEQKMQRQDAILSAARKLTLTECTEFVATLVSLAGSLWQIANPGARPRGAVRFRPGAGPGLR
jgi:hypothetical protein